MSSPTIYCPGCNERFPRAAAGELCPRCGVRVEPTADAVVDLERTRLLKSLSVDEASLEPLDAADPLIGGDLGVYHIEMLLGRGGMGRVYLATHRDLQRRCALKLIAPRLLERDSGFVERFLQEGRAAAALVHPNIVTTHAIGQVGDHHYLEMEFVAGESLQRLIDDRAPLDPLRATRLALQVAEGLSAAHRQGVVHRDLKPDNVLLTPQGVAKVADFGLAKRVIGGANSPRVEPLVGTPNYMAPELFAGEPAGRHSDVYALGVCYWLMLTGRLPFTAGSLSALSYRVQTEPLPALRSVRSDIPLEMAECVGLLLAKNPQDRPTDGIEAAQLLRAVLGQVRDLESLLRDAFADDPHVRWQRVGRQRYLVEAALPDGRRQNLFIEPSEAPLSDRLLLIYSVCCEAQPDWYEQALRLNAEVAHGGLAVREVDGRLMFVMVDTYPRATVDAEEIRRSTLEVALRADEVERRLTGLDRN